VLYSCPTFLFGQRGNACTPPSSPTLMTESLHICHQALLGVIKRTLSVECWISARRTVLFLTCALPQQEPTTVTLQHRCVPPPHPHTPSSQCPGQCRMIHQLLYRCCRSQTVMNTRLWFSGSWPYRRWMDSDRPIGRPLSTQDNRLSTNITASIAV
jgi:hypothetical protein